MFKFLQKRRMMAEDDRATLSELTAPYFASHEYQALISDRDRLRDERRQLLCTKHLWRVNRNSSRKQYYPWMIFFVCEHCMKDLAVTRSDIYKRLDLPDAEFRVLIATNTQVFINEIEQAKTILRSERK